MKNFEQMGNVRKAKLLSDLLPEEIPNLIFFIEKQVVYFLENEDQIIKNWNRSGKEPSADHWFGYVREVEKLLKQRRCAFFITHRWFSKMLFNSYKALFCIYCLVEYAHTPNCNHSLKYLIFFLFESERFILTNLKNNHHA